MKQEIVPINPGPPGLVVYVKARNRPELLFSETEEGPILEKVLELKAARNAFLAEASSVVVGSYHG